MSEIDCRLEAPFYERPLPARTTRYRSRSQVNRDRRRVIGQIARTLHSWHSASHRLFLVLPTQCFD